MMGFKPEFESSFMSREQRRPQGHSPKALSTSPRVVLPAEPGDPNKLFPVLFSGEGCGAGRKEASKNHSPARGPDTPSPIPDPKPEPTTPGRADDVDPTGRPLHLHPWASPTGVFPCKL